MAKRVKKFEDDEIAEAIRASFGLLGVAARTLSRIDKTHTISRQAIEKRVNASPELQEVVRQSIEAMTDFAENKLYELIKEGDKTAIIFYLKCKAKNRGYVERQEMTGKDGQPLSGKVEPLEVTIKVIDPGAKKG